MRNPYSHVAADVRRRTFTSTSPVRLLTSAATVLRKFIRGTICPGCSGRYLSSKSVFIRVHPWSELQPLQNLQRRAVHQTENQLRTDTEHEHQRDGGQDNQSLSERQIGEEFPFFAQRATPHAL